VFDRSRPSAAPQLLGVVGEELRIIGSARDGDVSHAVVEQVHGSQFGIDVDQHPVGGLTWLE
jgi:hypothetical protein